MKGNSNTSALPIALDRGPKQVANLTPRSDGEAGYSGSFWNLLSLRSTSFPHRLFDTPAMPCDRMRRAHPMATGDFAA
jgi:hypothetical protein